MLRLPLFDLCGVLEDADAADEVFGGGGTSVRRTIPLLFEGEEEDADPKEVSNSLLLLIIPPADKELLSEEPR